MSHLFFIFYVDDGPIFYDLHQAKISVHLKIRKIASKMIDFEKHKKSEPCMVKHVF